MLTHYRYHLAHNIAREKAYCLAILYFKFSEYSRKGKKPFSNLVGATSKAVLQTPFVAVTPSMPLVITKSKCASTNTSGPSCSPPSSWHGWLCGC
jgi:hypothetical protein